MTDTNEAIASLVRRVEVLEAEADIRRLQARYMFLCDTPIPEFGVADDEARIDLVMALYTEDAAWEGVGEYYDGQFGRAEGADAVRRHFEGFWSRERDPALVLNAHYLTSEQIHVDGDTATGQWIHVQPWLFSDGSSVLRSSRLNNAFRRVADTWKITRTRTENVFVAPLPDRWAADHGRRAAASPTRCCPVPSLSPSPRPSGASSWRCSAVSRPSVPSVSRS